MHLEWHAMAAALPIRQGDAAMVALRFRSAPPTGYHSGGNNLALFCAEKGVRRQNIWRSSRRRLAECGPRLGVDVKRRACGVASADTRWSAA